MKASVAALVACCALSCQASWSLPGIFGHDPGVVQPGINWLADNPLAAQGAAWSLFVQEGEAYRLMERGKAYHYNYVWREKGDSLEPQAFLIERSLKAAGSKGAGAGPGCAVVFTPAHAGTYRVSVDGLTGVQRAALGKARVELRVAAGQSLACRRVLSALDGKDKDSFAWAGEVELKDGEFLALALNPINAGAASCGYASLNIKGFTVSSKDDNTAGLTLDAAAWRPREPARVEIKPGASGELCCTVKPGAGGWIVLDGPSLAIQKRDRFAVERILEATCEAKAENAAGLVLQLRARQNGGAYTRNRAPHAYWDATLELTGAEKLKEWTQFEGLSSLGNDCTQLVFEAWLAVPRDRASTIVLRSLECRETSKPAHCLLPHPAAAGNIFFGDTGAMQVEIADAAAVASWRVTAFDELERVSTDTSGGRTPAPLTVVFPGKGFYRLVASATYTNGTKLASETTAAVVGEPLPDAVRLHSRFGSNRVHGDAGIWKKSGARWDWELQAIRLDDWVLHADGTISPPPGWKPFKQPQDYSPVYAVKSFPAWLHGPVDGKLCPPQDWALFGKLFEAFGKANPDLEYISMYNEPNACWTGSREEFIKFNTAMAEGLKRGNPQLKLLGPACYSIDMQEFRAFIKGGMFDSLGGVNMHAYVNATPPEDEFIARVQEMCAALKAAGKGDMPVHLTEFGWCSVVGDWQKTVPEETRMRYVARSLSLLAAQPVDNITYFCFQIVGKSRGPEYALLYPDGTPTPSYVSFVNAVKWLSEIKRGDARWFRLSPNLNLVLGKGAARTVGVAWTCEGEAPFQLPAPPVKLTDMMGRSLPALAGNTTVTLSPSPIFFELPADCAFLDMQELPPLSAVPGASRTLPLHGAAAMPGIAIQGDVASVAPTAKPGAYLLVGKTEVGAWAGQPVTVLAPLTFRSLACTLAPDGRTMTAEVTVHADLDGKAKGTLTLDSGATTTAEISLAQGRDGTLSLLVPGIRNGTRMKGAVVVELVGNVPCRLEQGFDQTVTDCPVLVEDAAGRVDWSSQSPFDFSSWGPDLADKGKQNAQLKAIAAADTSACLATAVGAKGFHLRVTVTDDVHLQTREPADMWREDSLQVAFDVDGAKEWQYNNIGDGRFNGHRIVEYGIALPTSGGAPLVWRWRADCPGLRAACREPAVVAHVERAGGITTYDILFPWPTLGLQEAPPVGSRLGFSLAVNDVDKGGDRHVLRFGGGITESKDPEKYGTLRVVNGPAAK